MYEGERVRGTVFRLNVGCKQIAQIFNQVIVVCSNRGHNRAKWQD